MKKILFALTVLILTMPTYAAPNNAQHRVAMSQRASVGTALANPKSSTRFDKQNLNTQVSSEDDSGTQDNRDAERKTCLANNIGVGATFVWASRDSDTNSYATMIEDTENPENNECFVLVEMRSNDATVNLSDISGKYFPMGQTITCGTWTDKSALENRILDAKKTARTLATIAGSVGGAGIGVGAMELFGNNLLAKAGLESVQGQKALSGDELFVSQLKVLKGNTSSPLYSNIITSIKSLKKECDKPEFQDTPDCKKINYDYILTELNE